MKKLLPALLFYLFSACLAAQQIYHPLLSGNVEWRESIFVYFGFGNTVNDTLRTGIDTTIGGQIYKKIIPRYGVDYNTSYMREDSVARKVYSLINGVDQLTYDFSLVLGDSAYLHWVDGFYGPATLLNGYYVVDSISVMSTLAGPRKFMRLKKGGTFEIYWLEGVGSLNDALDYPKHYCDLSDCGSSQLIYCQQRNGVQTFEKGPSYSCELGLIHDCSVTIGSSHVDTNYVFSAVTDGIGPYTYRWLVYNVDLNYALVDSSTYPSPRFGLPNNTRYLITVYTSDTTTPCYSSTSIAVYDTVPPVRPDCQALFWIYPDTVNGNYFAVDLSSGSSLSYLWNFGDGATSTSQYPNHQYATPDRYTVCLTVNNGLGCVSSHCDSLFYNFKTGGGPMSALNVINGPTAIKETAIDVEASIYPNPASDQLFINAGGLLQGVGIYNVTGELMMQTNANINKLMIGALAPGVYIAELQIATTGGSNILNTVKRRFVKM